MKTRVYILAVCLAFFLYLLWTPVYANSYDCSTPCDEICGADVACHIECEVYQNKYCSGMDLCGVPKVPPQRHRVELCNNEDCMLNEPLRLEGGKLNLCFSYQAPVNVLVGIMSEDFSQVWWLGPDCEFEENFGMLLRQVTLKNCYGVPLPIREGWLFWLVTTEGLSTLDWGSGPYELLFFDFHLICSPNSLEYCLTEEECVQAGGNWCDDVCQAEPCSQFTCNTDCAATCGADISCTVQCNIWQRENC